MRCTRHRYTLWSLTLDVHELALPCGQAKKLITVLQSCDYDLEVRVVRCFWVVSPPHLYSVGVTGLEQPSLYV